MQVSLAVGSFLQSSIAQSDDTRDIWHFCVTLDVHADIRFDVPCEVVMRLEAPSWERGVTGLPEQASFANALNIALYAFQKCKELYSAVSLILPVHNPSA